jgi:hypothetical protein
MCKGRAVNGPCTATHSGLLILNEYKHFKYKMVGYEFGLRYTSAV